MVDNSKDWVDIEIALIRRNIDELREEITRLSTAQEELAKKEYAARIVGRIAQRLVRITWYGVIGIGGYTLTHWAKIRAFVEGK